MSVENKRKSGNRTAQKVLIVVIVLLLMIAISAAVATIIHRRSDFGTASNVKDGLSAYELAIANGFDGSILDWLDSLQGKSAYDIA